MNQRKEKNVILCGAGRGLGNSVAKAFLTAGWNVIILDLSPGAQNKKQGVYWYRCDLSDFEATERCFEDIENKFQSADALVNCIRYRENKEEDLHFIEKWKKAMDVDLNTYYYTSSLICKWMKKKKTGCSIVNISSIISEQVSLKEPISYHAAKAAINQMTSYLAIQYGPYNIRANAISPGLISNEQSEASSDDPNATLYSKYAGYIPLRRSGSPQEVADLVLFLASPTSSFITGQNIVIDGGLNISEHLGLLPS